MIRNVAKPVISQAFTVEDMHKIREWHYEMLKDATEQERLNFYNQGTATIQRRVAIHTHDGQYPTAKAGGLQVTSRVLSHSID